MSIITEIEYLKEHGITRQILEGLPSRIPGIAPSVIRRMHSRGIIHRLEKDREHTTTWRGGCHYNAILGAWPCDP